MTTSANRGERYFADRDAAAAARDAKADDDDLIADQRDALRAEQDATAATFHPDAVRDRLVHNEDRAQAAADRRRARDDRRSAALDRMVAALDRSLSSIDDLTGAYRRDAGMQKLASDLSDAKRDNQPMILCFVDVDGLKAVNDECGHAAGDDLLRHVVFALRRVLRSFDPIVRYGGDEFLFGAVGMSTEEVSDRMGTANSALMRTHEASITYGLTSSGPADTLAGLVHRADGALYQNRLSARRGRRQIGPSD